jgi:ABC transporter substrate binding protein
VAITYRCAENQIDRLPDLAAELVRQRVAVLTATGGSAALAVKTATATIPFVFLAGEDPVRLGLATSLARPGDNATGINFFNAELSSKRLELLRELVPAAARVAVLVNPANPSNMGTTLNDVEAGARRYFPGLYEQYAAERISYERGLLRCGISTSIMKIETEVDCPLRGHGGYRGVQCLPR